MKWINPFWNLKDYLTGGGGDKLKQPETKNHYMSMKSDIRESKIIHVRQFTPSALNVSNYIVLKGDEYVLRLADTMDYVDLDTVKITRTWRRGNYGPHLNQYYQVKGGRE